MSNLFLIFFFIIVFALLGWVIYLTFLVKSYVADKKGVLAEAREKGLENVLDDCSKQIKRIDTDVKELYNISDQLNKIMMNSLTKVGIVRFNPFNDTGGDQSFALALLDANDNGVIISSLHSRAGTRMFAKPIKGGKSEYNLSDEEKQAIEKAQE
ncbi:MAG: DUF4446 family protein [Patescibacteria group bacterium]|nr:DUF4446 family protein [Patescibacteria group bacterium]